MSTGRREERERERESNIEEKETIPVRPFDSKTRVFFYIITVCVPLLTESFFSQEPARFQKLEPVGAVKARCRCGSNAKKRLSLQRTWKKEKGTTRDQETKRPRSGDPIHRQRRESKGRPLLCTCMQHTVKGASLVQGPALFACPSAL